MTGRSHRGDENGSTTYWCSRIRIDGEPVSTGNVWWGSGQKEGGSYFVGSGDEVILVEPASRFTAFTEGRSS
ncbi:hypothetical protein [Streptosporangium sp. NPDC002607]